MAGEISLIEVSGRELEPYLDDLGRMRIEVFREFPYLYDGSLEYEREYLKTYINAPRSLVVLALEDGKVRGASTCIPMADEGPEFQEPFLEAGMDIEEVFYFGESILDRRLRGRGIGREFFRRREAHARAAGGFAITTFCAVDRSPDHPRRPADYRPLDAFWSGQGYVKHPELRCTFHWKEIDEEQESPKTLTFWLKQWQIS